MLDFMFKKKKYLNCPYLKNGIHFFMDDIRACCSNVRGPVFYKNYDGSESVDWDYVYKKRLKYVKKINSAFNNKSFPDECRGCYLIPKFLSDKKVPEFENKVSTFWIQNNMFCNAKCIYCVFSGFERDYKYDVIPLLKDLIKHNYFDKNAEITLSGGEITIIPDFDELLEIFLSYFNSKIHIFTSGIKYSTAIEKALGENRCDLLISLDSGTRETYLAIKGVDCFEKITDNLKNYISKTPNAKESIFLKYILINAINDNYTELEKFLNLVSELGIKKVLFDIDYLYYRFENNRLIPKFYYKFSDKYKELAEVRNLNFVIGNQTRAILDKWRTYYQ